LFPNIFRFFFIGSQNKAFYEYYGVAESNLVFTPYTIDNQRFGEAYEQYKLQIPALKQALNLPQKGRIVLFSGKFIDKKRPMDLLQAFVELQRQDAYLLFVGDGELRPKMETYIASQNAKNIIITGFVNQSLIPQYYAVADVFVMCSQEGETWGLSTNEAMNFAMPILLSDLTGSASDLVEEGKNGFVFKTGDIEALKTKLSKLLDLSDENLKEMGLHSKNKIATYSYTTIVHNLEQAL
jgi:glycosyltransferase involved in cell wall biosynthesis